MRKHLKRYLPTHDAVVGNRWLNPFRTTLLHPRLWHLNRHSAAGAVAAGLFCGLIPGPLQMLGAAICALIFRVNLPLSMLMTLYTNPLTLIPLYVLAFELGGLISGNGAAFTPPPEMLGSNLSGWFQAMSTWMISLGKPLLIGLPALATLLAVVGYFLTHAAWRIYLIRSWQQRQRRSRPIA